MVATCFRIRSILTEMVGNHASEADRLRVEEHLATCEPCRQEKARWLLLETLRDQPVQGLSSAARDRVLSAVLAAPRGPVERPVRRVSPRVGVAVAAVACAAVVGIGLWVKTRPDRVVERAPIGSPTLPKATLPKPGPGQDLIVAENPGSMAYGGARIRYLAGASFRIEPQRRHVELLKGELDVEVTPGLPGRFRVDCARFSVEVLGTHFIVGQDHVRTLHGKVRVLDGEGTEVAIVAAGQSWRYSQPTPPAKVFKPGPVAAVGATGAAPRRRPRAIPRGPSVEQLLSEARTVLGAGNPAQARARLDQALDAEPTRRQRAQVELLAADTLLVESKYTAALAGYRRTLALFDGFPEAETAAFAMAQLLIERGSVDEARRALSRYLERYPEGRFHQEVSRKLASLSRP